MTMCDVIDATPIVSYAGTVRNAPQMADAMGAEEPRDGGRRQAVSVRRRCGETGSFHGLFFSSAPAVTAAAVRFCPGAVGREADPVSAVEPARCSAVIHRVNGNHSRTGSV